MSFMTAGLVFLVYSLLNGVMFSVIFLAYTMESIASTFFITAGTFGAMSFVGYFMKKDLSAVGRFLTMALIGQLLDNIATEGCGVHDVIVGLLGVPHRETIVVA